MYNFKILSKIINFKLVFITLSEYLNTVDIHKKCKHMAYFKLKLIYVLCGITLF